MFNLLHAPVCQNVPSEGKGLTCFDLLIYGRRKEIGKSRGKNKESTRGLKQAKIYKYKKIFLRGIQRVPSTISRNISIIPHGTAGTGSYPSLASVFA